MAARIRNSANVDFTASGGDWTSAAPDYYVGVWVNDSGGADRYLGATGKMTGVGEAVEDGETIRFAANAISLSIGPASGQDGGEAGLKALLDAANAASNVSFKFSLHDADPGTTGAGELAAAQEKGYARAAGAVTIDTN
ncbi:MAG: hypothetical protein OXG90_09830 [Gammaproteobacteria bacterium]|nr:hypothetical protein [Gammaproteobacteria bacterium]